MRDSVYKCWILYCVVNGSGVCSLGSHFLYKVCVCVCVSLSLTLCVIAQIYLTIFTLCQIFVVPKENVQQYNSLLKNIVELCKREILFWWWHIIYYLLKTSKTNNTKVLHCKLLFYLLIYNITKQLQKFIQFLIPKIRTDQ